MYFGKNIKLKVKAFYLYPGDDETFHISNINYEARRREGEKGRRREGEKGRRGE